MGAEHDKHALVVGASGLLGAHLVDALNAAGSWSVTTLSRRPAGAAGGRHLAIDLEDRDACLEAARSLAGITHVFYGSRSVGPGYSIDHAVNHAMLRNLCDAFETAVAGPLHVQLVHGLKWYGFNVGPAPTPAHESAPPHPGASFYAQQRDFLRATSERLGWSWSTVRPHLICAVARNSPSNIVSVIGTFAAILKEMGEPLWFPGPAEAFEARITMSDIALLCRSMIWVAAEEITRNQDFNTVNGDTLRWCDIWPAIASVFDMPMGDVRPTRLVDFMDDKAGLWSEMAAASGLEVSRFADMCDWSFADASLGLGWDQVASADKLHAFGFSEVVESRDMFLNYLRAYRTGGLLP